MLTATKDQILEEVFDTVARTVDAQGRRIDSGIIATVLYLQIHRIRTVSSCEGHLDHGQHYPWVMCPIDEQACLTAIVERFGGSLVVDCDMVEDQCILRPLITQAQRLRSNQQEMYRFTEWLRDRFFEQEECYAA